MALAALAILGHRSAHSFPIGPVIADPATRTEHAQKSSNSYSINSGLNELHSRSFKQYIIIKDETNKLHSTAS